MLCHANTLTLGLILSACRPIRNNKIPNRYRIIEPQRINNEALKQSHTFSLLCHLEWSRLVTPKLHIDNA